MNRHTATYTRLIIPILGMIFGWPAGCALPPTGSPSSLPPPLYSVQQPDDWPAPMTLRLRKHNGYLLAPTRINGQTAGLFLIDTGSSMNVLATGVAGRMALPTGRQGVAQGIAGQAAYTIKHVESLTINDVALAGTELAELDLHRIGRVTGGSLNGIIGYNAIRDLPFTIDFQASTLTLWRPNQLTPDHGTQPYRLRDYRGLPLVRATVGSGHDVWLIVDTGADAQITLPTSCVSRWPDIVAVPVTGRGLSRGVGGTITSVRSWLTSLRLFGLNLHHIPVNFEQPSPTLTHGPRGQVIGRIGHRLLENFRLTFDAKNQRIWARWLPDE